MKLFCIAVWTVCAMAMDKKVKLEDLPSAVQTAVKDQTRNATLVGLSTEYAVTADGKTKKQD